MFALANADANKRFMNLIRCEWGRSNYGRYVARTLVSLRHQHTHLHTYKQDLIIANAQNTPATLFANECQLLFSPLINSEFCVRHVFFVCGTVPWAPEYLWHCRLHVWFYQILICIHLVSSLRRCWWQWRLCDAELWHAAGTIQTNSLAFSGRTNTPHQHILSFENKQTPTQSAGLICRPVYICIYFVYTSTVLLHPHTLSATLLCTHVYLNYNLYTACCRSLLLCEF